MICHGKLIPPLVNVHVLTTLGTPVGNLLQKLLVGGDVPNIGWRLADWLGVMFGQQFTLLSLSLLIRKQGDFNSCGIYVMNAIEHVVLGILLSQKGEAPALCPIFCGVHGIPNQSGKDMLLCLCKVWLYLYSFHTYSPVSLRYPNATPRYPTVIPSHLTITTITTITNHHQWTTGEEAICNKEA